MSCSLTNHAGFKALAGKVGPFRYVFFVVVILSVVFTIISFRTNFGRWLFAIGSNSKTSYGKGKLVGGIISAFTIVCLRIGLGQRNMNPQLILLILGILLITAVMIPNLVGDFKARKAMKK